MRRGFTSTICLQNGPAQPQSQAMSYDVSRYLVHCATDRLPAPCRWFRVTMPRAVDGDTVAVDVALGLGVWLREQRLRLVDIDAPEIFPRAEPGSEQSRAALQRMLDGRQLRIKATRRERDKHGRIECELYARADDGRWINVNMAMIEGGHAKRCARRGRS